MPKNSVKLLLPAYGNISFTVLQGVSPCHVWVDLASKEWKLWDTAIFLIRNDVTVKEDVYRFINRKCSLIEKDHSNSLFMAKE